MLRIELLRSRVGRRILLLFVLSALAPIVVLAGYSFTAVTDQLRNQSRDRLQQLSKSAGMSVMERLQDAESDLELAAADVRRLGDREAAGGAPVAPRSLRSIVRVAVTPLGGRPDGLAPEPELRDPEWSHLSGGGALLRVRPDSAGAPALWMVKLLDAGRPEARLLWSLLDADYLWSSAQQYVDLPTISGFCILRGVQERLHCANGYGTDDAEGMVRAFRTSPADGRGVFSWSSDGPDQVGSFWELFLRSRFQTGSWSILVSESEDMIYRPLRSFALAFPPVLLFGLIVVSLLANSLVRRTMEPLERLTEGTRRIAAKDFDIRVEGQREDEFGQLARSFNDMAERLGVQFRHLEASRAIDQAVLSASHRDEVVHALLTGFGSVIPYDRLAVLLLDRDQRTGTLCWSGTEEVSILTPSPADLQRLRGAGRDALVADAQELSMVRDFPEDVRPVLVLPFMVKGEVRGALMIGRRRPLDSEEILRARQIVDQAAVALDEVQLVTELEEMSWGTLRALARAIDAKSRWTAGHSERVVRLALAIGREMNLSDRDLDVLERGGLLHDVGKIGIPARVLDSERDLSPEERTVMQSHVVIGARILEPVAAYADAIPIVLYHHERWDGSGYPEALSGEDIPFLARILAVADTYDAMASVRPYRSSVTPERVIEHIEGLSGFHFDPRVVEAFARVVLRDAELRESIGQLHELKGASPGG